MNSLLKQELWKWKLLFGLLTVVLGGIVLTWPGPTILVASTLFGIYLVLAGFTELFLASTLPRSGVTRVLVLITGVVSLFLAVLSFRHLGDAYAVLLLSIWIGVGFVFQGASEVAVSIGEQNLSGRGKCAVLGVISEIVGFVILFWPFASTIVLMLVVGVWLVVMGVVQTVQALQIRKDPKVVREAVDFVSERLAPRQRPAWCDLRTKESRPQQFSRIGPAKTGLPAPFNRPKDDNDRDEVPLKNRTGPRAGPESIGRHRVECTVRT